MGIFSKIKDALSDVQQQNRENAKEKTAPKEIFDRLRNKLEEVQKDQQSRKASKKGRTRGSIFSQIKEQFEQAQKANKRSKKEETADTSIMDRIQKEMDAIEKDKKVKVEKKMEESPSWGSPAGAPPVDDILGRVLAGAHKEQQQAKKSKKTAPKKEEDFGSIFDSIMNPDKPKASKTTKAKKAEKKPTFGEMFDQLMQEEKQAASKKRSTAAAGLQVGGSALVDGKGGSLSIRTDPKMSAGTLAQRLPDNVNVRLLDYNGRNKINLDGKVSGWYLVDYQGMQGWVLESYLE